jgi:hypothetical protein
VEKFTKILGKNGTNNSGQTENKTDKYVVQKVFLMLRMPSLPAIFGQETLISGCYDLAKFALITWLISLATPPPPPIQRGLVPPLKVLTINTRVQLPPQACLKVWQTSKS